MVAWTFLAIALKVFKLVYSHEMRTESLWKVPSKRFKDGGYEEVSIFNHRIFCISHCLNRTRCKSVAWNGVTRQCQVSNLVIMHDRIIDRRMEFDTDWNGYALVTLPVFHAQSHLGNDRLTLDEASRLCEDRGHQLASYSEMAAAHADGFKACACGWVSDGIKIIVNQRVNIVCQLASIDGILECNIIGKGGLADAWCKVI